MLQNVPLAAPKLRNIAIGDVKNPQFRKDLITKRPESPFIQPS